MSAEGNQSAKTTSRIVEAGGMNRAANTYVASVVVLGTACASSRASPRRPEFTLLLTYLIAAVATSAMKISLPSIHGTLSVNFFSSCWL
jgi:hypothetical protein